MADQPDFYEDDEPLEDVLAAWERGVKGATAPPIWGYELMPGQWVTLRSPNIRGVPTFAGHPMVRLP